MLFLQIHTPHMLYWFSILVDTNDVLVCDHINDRHSEHNGISSQTIFRLEAVNELFRCIETCLNGNVAWPRGYVISTV